MDATYLAVAGVTAAASAGAGVWLYLRSRITPDERERRRRIAVHRVGRMLDGFATDLRDDYLFYSYSTAGVTYAASQDISRLRDFLPEDVGRALGPATVKIEPQNPYNSIVVCEEWSGLRFDLAPAKSA